MHILHRWTMSLARTDRKRTVAMLFAGIGFFALWVCADFIVLSIIDRVGIDEINRYGFSVPSLLSCMRESGLLEGFYAWLHKISQEPFSGDLFTNSLFRALVNYLFGGLFLVMIVVLYSAFSITAEESLQDYHILTSCGVTSRQIYGILLQSTVLLTLLGAAVGNAVGLVAARLAIGFVAGDTDGLSLAERLTLGRSLFFDELPKFFHDPRTHLMDLVGLFLAPCVMTISFLFAFRRRRREKPLRAPRHNSFRHPIARRLFGSGGLLGGISSRKNIRFRFIFTASFTAGLTLLALMSNLLLTFKEVKPLLQGFDLRIECGSNSRTDVLNALLLQNADRLGITRRVTISVPAAWRERCNILFDADWVSDQLPDGYIGSSFALDGRSVRLCRNRVDFAFLDDAEFDRYAQENGLPTGTDGAIFYNFRYFTDQKRVAPLQAQAVDPDRNVTLFFLPENVQIDEQALGTEFLHAADLVAQSETVRILGLTDTAPFELSFDCPTLLFPRRMYASLAALLSDGTASAQDTEQASGMETTYFLALSETLTEAEKTDRITAFADLIKNDPHLHVKEEVFGMQEPDNAKRSGADASQSDLPAKDDTTTVNDLQDLHKRLNAFQAMIPRFLLIFLVVAIWILFVSVLNTAHMNRMTRRREMAILVSIGMGNREHAGMRLYESTRYALNSIALSLLAFTVIFFPLWGDYQDLLWDNSLLSQSQRVTLRNLILYGTAEDRIPFLTAYVHALGRTWWIFLGGAVLIFVLLIATDKTIDRRIRREDLIQILKDDTSRDYYTR